jgi:predicted branched-subunit amino acid permease
MKPVLTAGIIIVNLALLCYSIAIITQTRKKVITKQILLFLCLGVLFDMSSTLCMILGSSEGAITLHGFIGYSSLAGMITDTIFTARNAKIKGLRVPLSSKFLSYSLLAYFYWIVAYVTGAVIIGLR